MKVGIIGLGLIGGSMAKAYTEAGHTVYGQDISKETENSAVMAGVIGDTLDNHIADCDLFLIALYPKAAISFMELHAKEFRHDAIVMDLCGVKRTVCKAGFAISAQNGFIYVGGHPMAGTQYSGLRYSKATLFRGAPMVLVLPEDCDGSLLYRVKDMLAPAGFGRFSVTTAEAHDRMIAFTSQLAHVVSNAYIKSPTAEEHKGFSAGSYKDMTRVAWLNEAMWTELFLENRDDLLDEIDTIIKSLGEYRTALADGDAEKLCTLLKEGRLAKERVDG